MPARVLLEIARRALWFPLIVFLAHVVAVFLTDLYVWIPHLDIAAHLVGGVAIAFFFHRSLGIMRAHGLLGPEDPRLSPVLLFALVCTATVFWEFGEYILDHVAGTDWQEGIDDTLKDMLFGILGGSAFVIAVGNRSRDAG